MLTMRFLLTFYSETADQLRCLDTAHLPAFRSGRMEDIPAALRQEPDLVMRWMLGCYKIADVLITGPQSLRRTEKQGDLITVYALDPECTVIGLGNDYHGAWLEMFLHGNHAAWVYRHPQGTDLADDRDDSLARRAGHPSPEHQ